MHLRAFTLIELLVVSAVIGVLAAVALPNFLEARTRALVTRVKADQKTIANALELYRIDHNGLFGHPRDDGFYYWYAFGLELTTPVAYVATRDALEDPFGGLDYRFLGEFRRSIEPVINNEYAYVNWDLRDREMIDEQFQTFSQWNYPQWYGAVKRYRQKEFESWEIASLGPTADFQAAVDPSTRWGHYFLLYDPTNGTISDGAIVRNRANVDGVPLTGYIADGLPGQ